ncbi:Protein-lysine N-methyltransferase efm6 [Leucoagaricus gongylophorus]
MATENSSSDLPAVATIALDTVLWKCILDSEHQPESRIDEEPLTSTKSKSELLAVLPHQHFSESDGVLDLTFSLTHGMSINSLDEMRESQVSVKLAVDSAPGCGGIAWPAGQVRPLFVLWDHSRPGEIIL